MHPWGRIMTDVEIKARMFAALSATNEAILKARSATELYRQVCEAAVEGGRFRSAGALFPDDKGELNFAAAVGFKVKADSVKTSIKSDNVRGQGLTATVY